MDIGRSVLISSFLSTVLFSTTALATDCKALFNKLDKHLYQIPDKRRIKKLIALEDALFKAIDKCRTKAGMFVLMGELQIEMGQVPLAVVYGQKAVEIDNKYWRSYNLLGSARMLNHETNSGLKALRQAVILAPDNVNSKLNLVSALLQNKEFDKALKRVNKIIMLKDKTTLAIAYYFRGQIYKGKGLVIEADKDLKQAQKLGFKK